MSSKIVVRLPSYSATLPKLCRLAAPGIRQDLEPVRAFLRELAFPLGEAGKPFPSLLIAGTNGKGSTAAMLSEILRRCGYRVGLYSSPHLIRYRERIQIHSPDAGSCFPEASWRRNFAKIAGRIQSSQISLTQFEILTILAFLIFQEEKVDLAVLEVGMGGRWDATNVIEPILGVITSIERDHQDFLGNTLAEIAAEKAGILREQGTAVAVAQSGEVLEVLRETAGRKNAKLSWVKPGTLLSLSLEEQTFEYKGEIFRQKLLGNHQVKNACLAVEAARKLRESGFRVSEEKIAEGVWNAVWPGRMEVLSRNPVILLDGAHNPDGAESLAKTLSQLRLPSPLIFILGILSTKNAGEILNGLSPLGDIWILCRSHHPKALSPEELFPLARKAAPGKEIQLAKRVGEAFRLALSLAASNGTVCVTGSLTTVGEARRLFFGGDMPSA